ncbi:Alpha-mannosidase [hydrothermal vent metagenome]|uniref:Alpha-mannosidase n=1 Tax=hydrothermal vent metagenome TaxID=652676 RepID=A0A3B1C0V1_9ZZZZ
MAKDNDKGLKFHFIPNTHWDREWLYDFQETRMFLVEFMDKLLTIFNDYPEYKTYLLDSQIIPVEDYLAIRPEKKDEISKRIQEGRLQVGPWYTLPEEHLVNGESLVRNLLMGHRITKQYGEPMKVGYSPFSYGQASQMPQIYKGFDIDTILFYHGVNSGEVPAEFIFEGADGTQILASRMGSNARYNFFFTVYRPSVYGKEILERDYNWDEKGLPFHLAAKGKHMGHHILLDPIKELDTEAVKRSMDELREIETKHATTNNIACMQGMDSTQPDVYEMKTMQEAAKNLTDDEIFHSSLPEFINALKNSVDWDNLIVLKGERRTPRQLGTRKHLYGDVTSTRTNMKRKNALAEQELQRKAEPYSVIAFLLGREYPKNYLDMAWKYLLQSHPHDSISGTGLDQIEKDVHHRLDQCRSIANGIINRSLQAVQLNIDNSDLADNEIALTVYNPTPYSRSEIVTAVFDLPLRSGFKNYTIVDGITGEKILFQEEARYEHAAIVRHLGDATMEMPSLRVHAHLHLDDIPALGYKTLVVKPAEEFHWTYRSLVTGQNKMENDFISVVVNENGTLDITDRSTGHVYEEMHYFSDDGEVGHAWRHVPPAYDRVITTLNSTPKIELIQNGPELARYAVTHSIQIPIRMDEGKGDYVRRLDADGDDAGRSTETREMIIRSEFTLTKNSKGVSVKTTFFNTCEDHRLRVMFPSYINSKYSYAEEPFDVIEREIDRDDNSPWAHTWNPTHPHQRFVDVSDGKVGLAIVNDGLREYEVTDNESRTIGITLLRSFEIALATVAWKWERHPEMKGSQSLGDHEFNYFIYPHKGDWDEGGVMQQADYFNVPIDVAQAGPHEGTLPKSFGFVELGGKGLMLSSIKKAEESESIIIRVYNPTKRTIDGKLRLFKEPAAINLLNLNEEILDEEDLTLDKNEISFEAKAKKIITIEIKFN